MAHHRRMGTLFGWERYEDHTLYDREDRLQPPSPGSHPPPIEPQVMPQEPVSLYDRGWMR